MVIVFALATSALGVVPRPMKTEILGGEIAIGEAKPQAANDPSLGDEGYIVEIAHDGVTIRANSDAGFFYARQTLAQLGDRAPCQRITDRPRFAHRGLLLDSARHMQDIEWIKCTIDKLARYKINRLHWHLTDDVGWRIESKRFPKLNLVGSWRCDDDDPYGGYYTQEELRDIVAYAAQRFVTIIPEIEMPGHCQAMIAAYPEISCRGEAVEVLAEFKQSHEVLCPANPRTYEFVQAMLDEVMEIFPSPVIHIGGDECPRTRWNDCPRCQQCIKHHNLKNADELQARFTRQIADYLHSRGRRTQGWGEIFCADLRTDAIVQQWLDPRVGPLAAAAGHDVVVSQHEFLYLDYGDDRTPLKKIYDFDPLPAGISPEIAKRFIGVQAQLWTENLPSETHCDRRLWPRMAAVAEIGWSQPDVRDFDDFLARLKRSATIAPAEK